MKMAEKIIHPNDPHPLASYVTSEDRLAEIEKELSEVTNYKDLCRNVLKDIYENELAEKHNRNRIIVSLPFVSSIVPLVKNLEGDRVCNVRNIRKGIFKYLLDKETGKVKEEKVAKVKETPSLMDCITDDNRRIDITKRLSEATDLKTICRDIIIDVYENELDGKTDRRDIVVSKPFIQSIMPFLKNFHGALTLKNLHYAIYRYVLVMNNAN